MCAFTSSQGWIKCGSGEHRSQEMTRKIEEIITLGYEEKEKREEELKEKRVEEEKEKREEEEREEEEKKRREIEKKRRGRNWGTYGEEEEEEHGYDKLIVSQS